MSKVLRDCVECWPHCGLQCLHPTGVAKLYLGETQRDGRTFLWGLSASVYRRVTSVCKTNNSSFLLFSPLRPETEPAHYRDHLLTLAPPLALHLEVPGFCGVRCSPWKVADLHLVPDFLCVCVFVLSSSTCHSVRGLGSKLHGLMGVTCTRPGWSTFHWCLGRGSRGPTPS